MRWALLWTAAAALGALASGRAWPAAAAVPTEVRALSAEPDFRQVSLHWLYPSRASDLFAFRVDYCELQAWGVNRCRTKMVDAPPRPPVTGRALVGEELSEYGAVVTGLRMATNYTFSVAPVEGRLQPQQQHPGFGQPRDRHAPSRTIMAPTKGFSARATLCLPDVSEVEVHTGPHFSGRIAVEANDDAPPWGRSEGLEPAGRGLSDLGVGGDAAAADEPCAVAGDPSSARESYTLRIDHRRCGSHVNRSTVATFILVQENLPILTHSTRRFLVLCTFQPDALIVRAGISLPTVHGEHRSREDLGDAAHGNQLGRGAGSGAAGPAEVMAFQLQQEQADDDLNNAVPSARQQRRHAGRALGLAADQDARTRQHAGAAAAADAPGAWTDGEAREAQLVMASVLLVSGVVLAAIAAWWFAPSRKRPAGDDALTEDSASVYQNYENSLRDSDCSSIGTVGTVNSSILSSLSRHHWAAAVADLREEAKFADEFGEVRAKDIPADPPSSLVFAIRLPDAAGTAPVLPRITAPVVVPSVPPPEAAEASSACSVSIGEPQSLSSDA